MARSNRQKLKELLKADPALAAEVRALVLGEAEETPTEVEASFSGTHEVLAEDPMTQPIRSKSGATVKYDIQAPIITDDGESDLYALVVAYLPPEVAGSSIEVMVESSGLAQTGRERQRAAS